MPNIPAPKPRVSPFALPLGMRRRNAYGVLPIDPQLLPMNLLRAHLYPGNPEAVAEGIEEFHENIERGGAVPMLPQRMAFQWHKRGVDGYPADPRSSAASVAAAVAATGRVASFVNEVTVTPREPHEAAMRAAVQRNLFARHVSREDAEPEDAARGAAQTRMASDAELLDSYGAASAQVAQTAVGRRQTFIGRAMNEIAFQSGKVLGMLKRNDR